MALWTLHDNLITLDELDELHEVYFRPVKQDTENWDPVLGFPPLHGWDSSCPVQDCRKLLISSKILQSSVSEWLSYVKSHLRETHPLLLPCPEDMCLSVFLEKAWLDIHLAEIHGGKRSRAAEAQSTLLFGCALCNARHESRLRSNNHLLRCHHLEGIVCGGTRDTDPTTCVCGLILRNAVDLFEHKQRAIEAAQQQLISLKMEVDEDIDLHSIVMAHPQSESPIKGKFDEDVKLHSVEMYTWAERRFLPPRDSLEPEHYGELRNTDEVVMGGTRNTDELVRNNHAMRATDELVTSLHMGSAERKNTLERMQTELLELEAQNKAKWLAAKIEQAHEARDPATKREPTQSRADSNEPIPLQDYQTQLMLLEQQNKKRLMMAKQGGANF